MDPRRELITKIKEAKHYLEQMELCLYVPGAVVENVNKKAFYYHRKCILDELNYTELKTLTDSINNQKK